MACRRIFFFFKCRDSVFASFHLRSQIPTAVQTFVKSIFMANQHRSCSVYLAAAATRRPSPFRASASRTAPIKQVCLKVGDAHWGPARPPTPHPSS